MRIVLLALCLILAALLSSASFAKSPPWNVPKSDFGGAEPLNKKEWYKFQDYPYSAVSTGKQGYVTVAFAIGVDGRMTDCHVIRASGHPVLDVVPCKVLPKRARFRPAQDAEGQPRATVGSTSMLFWLPSS